MAARAAAGLAYKIQQVTPDIAESLGLKDEDGALIAGVTTGGPADHAHIQNGDVILTFNNQKLKEMRTLPRVVAETTVDKQVPVEIWRAGHDPDDAKSTVAEMPDDEKARQSRYSPHKPAANSKPPISPRLGLKLSAHHRRAARQIPHRRAAERHRRHRSDANDGVSRHHAA